jgi:hypothetical protein
MLHDRAVSEDGRGPVKPPAETSIKETIMATKKTSKKKRTRAPLIGNGELVWEEPPPPTRQRLTLPAEALKGKAGKWAVIKTALTKGGASSAASYLKKRLAEEGVEGFEVRAAETKVYARFIG